MIKQYLLAVLALSITQSTLASGMINTGGYDSAKYCLDKETPRQTYLIIDSESIRNNSADWAHDIMQTLPPSYLPSEKIGIYHIKGDGNISHTFTTCYPNTDMLPKGGLLSASPERVVREDLPKFTRLLQRGLSEAMKASSHSEQPDYSSRIPNKNLARSLFQVSNDIRLNGTPIRLVVYSDGIQNSKNVSFSSLSSTNGAIEAGSSLAKTHKANFNNATVYFHGVNSTGVNNAYLEAFWGNYLQASSGHLKHFSQSLPGMNRPEYNTIAISESYSGDMTSSGIKTLFNIRIERPKSPSRGEVNQAFAAINGHSMLLKGTFETNNKENKYMLEITQAHPDLGFQLGDNIVLTTSGKEASGFIGDLSPSVVNKETNEKFQFPLELVKDSFLRY